MTLYLDQVIALMGLAGLIGAAIAWVAMMTERGEK